MNFDAADAQMIEARSEVLDLLYRGKRVGKFTLSDALDCQIDKNFQDYSEAVAILEALASSDYICSGINGPDELEYLRGLKSRVQRLVEKFVDSHDELVEDLAEVIEREEEACS